MSRCIPKVLVQGEHFNISTCSSCKRIGFCYKNLISGFDRNDFVGFAQSIIKTPFEKFAVPFPPYGEERIVIKTCHEDIQFCFHPVEFSELKDSLQEALLLIEVESVLK
ncbi:MAG: hypothetical protein HEP71_14785 [Roseivirga sp.]|nr:hypothetical protein [Roseivirga sp.]